MIGTLWHSKRYQNVERIFLVVRQQEKYVNYNGYTMLDLMSGHEMWGFEMNGKMHIPATGSIELDRFE